MELRFVVGNSFDSEHEIIDLGKPWHNARIRVYHRIDPGFVASYREHLETSGIVGWGVGSQDTPIDAIRIYNQQIDDGWNTVLTKYPDVAGDMTPTPHLKGLAYYVSDGHYEFIPV